jgi:hypothetical protein
VDQVVVGSNPPPVPTPAGAAVRTFTITAREDLAVLRDLLSALEG